MGRASVVDSMEIGTRALAAGDWVAARDAFAVAVTEGGSTGALDGLGRAKWWLKDVSGAIEACTHAYTALRREGRFEEAARVAVWLAREHRSLYRNDAVADGWVSRARSAADRAGDCGAHGWIRVAQAEGSLDVERAVDLVRGAVSLARQHDDADLETVALARLGALEVAAGAVEFGQAHIDEAMAAATAGEGLDPRTIGEACCALMEVAALLGDGERVGSWAGAVDRFRGSYGFGPLMAYGRSPTSGVLSAFCGACCGGIYLVTGRLDDAEEELTAAIAELQASHMHSRCVHPVTQLAELRVLQGRLEEAEALLSAFEDLPECVRPLSALDLARGSPDRAAARLRARIDVARDLEVTTFPLWTLLVDAEIACGELTAAQRAAEEVARIASVTRSSRHGAEAAFATAKVAAARDDKNASTLLRRAASQLAQVSLALSACRARMAHARALGDSDRGVAVSEARAALAAFERLGATLDADAAAAYLRELGVRGRTGPRNVGLLSRREQEVLRLLTEGLSNAEIAERLYISVKTAGHHVSNILAKLGVRSRTEAAAYAVLNLPREPAGK